MPQTTAEILGVGIVSFVSTNLDDLILLFFLFSSPKVPKISVVAGQYIGMIVLILLSSISSFFGSMVLPQDWLHFLGIIPILLGGKKLWELKEELAQSESTFQTENRTVLNKIADSPSQILAVALTTITYGGDNLAVYVPIFSTHGMSTQLGLIVIYLIMTGLWCALAYSVASKVRALKFLRSFEHVLFPVALMILGLWVLFR